jgi:TRAP-type C4-dicarboxylate transport system substrate-binding protein
MKITVKQLKQLIREATEEAVQEMHGHMHDKEEGMPEEGMHEEGMHEKDMEKEEAVMMEAVKAAYRAGLRKGRSVRR